VIFRQLFDMESSSYTYLLAARPGGEAVIIDPVLSMTDIYMTLINQLDIKLVFAMDTHTHADHITALGSLRDKTQCITIMGHQTKADCVSRGVDDGELIEVDGLRFKSVFTPGHTDESYSFVMADRVFTGDVLLYRSTGRTDFQNGDPHKSWDSIINKLFKLPEETLVYAAHDYKGWTVSTINEEKKYNPRIAGKLESEYVDIMNSLNLPNPKLMDIAVTANLACGKIGK
jgi:sulfur dioxygenase